MPIRLNPPAPLSLAAHFDAETKSLQQAQEILTAHNRLAKQLGFNFEGREDTLALLKRIDMLAHQWTAEVSDGVRQEKPDQKFVESAIHLVAHENDIFPSLLVSAGAQAGPAPKS